MNICVPPKFVCWNLILRMIMFGDGAFGRGGGHEGGALRKGISALMKEISASSLVPSCMWRRSEKIGENRLDLSF